MQPVCDDALNEWKSLYSKETQSVWNSERKELRRFAMVFHVLKQEFALIESNLSRELDNFREKVDFIDDSNKKSSSSISSEACPEESVHNINNIEESQLSRSPKLNKYRKKLHLKLPVNSPSLLAIQNKSISNTTVAKANESPKSEELFDSPIYNNLLTSFEDSVVDKSYAFKTPQGIKRLANADVVDSSFIIDDTPDKNVDKKIKWTRKHPSKTTKEKKKKSYTLTQMFDSFPNQNIKFNAADSDKSRNAKQTVHDKLKESNPDDETFFVVPEDDYKDITTKNMKSKENIPISNTFFRDYNKIPEVKTTSPQHVHKTEVVRRKADRMKLPGWTCSDCEEYYKGLNLSPEELRKKMNACSKHRNKFQVLDRTRNGFWDVDMPPTQKSQSDTTNF